MSLNVLLTAVDQRTAGLPTPLASPSTASIQNGIIHTGSMATTEVVPQDDALRKKRKRNKGDMSVSSSNSLNGKLSPAPGDDEEEKQRKRRAQIAEASRRSRARRKKEFQDFKEENDQLWSQNMLLRKTLQDLGVDLPPQLVSRLDRGSSTPGGGASHNNTSDEEDDDDVNPSACPSPGVSLASSPINHQMVQQAAAAASAMAGALGSASTTGQLNWNGLVHNIEAIEASDASASSPGGFQDFCQFFERRLSWYFTQLKSDTIRSFASQLPYDEKQKIANLQVRLALGDGHSPTVTPLIAGSAVAARQASATSAEQAVDQDKKVRL